MRKNKYKTHYGGLLTTDDVNQKVKICGWVENIRDHGGIIFVDIRDYYGIIQVVSNDNNIFSGLTRESSVSITGTVRMRDENDFNPKLKQVKLKY